MLPNRRFRSVLAVFVLMVLGAASATTVTAQTSSGPSTIPGLLPIVFVHGQSGSAQQFESQAMRFASHGYPQDLLFAYEYDTSLPTNDLERLDDFIDEVLAETGAEQVNLIGHSRGTSYSTAYLDNDEDDIDGASKVAKYINIDGRSPDEEPGGVKSMGIWGEWNSAGSPNNRRGGADALIGTDIHANHHFPDKGHTEVATSAGAFVYMFYFLTGEFPSSPDIIPEPPGQVTIAGRAVLFPQNTGYAGTTVEVWHVDPATGQRIDEEPRHTVDIDETGDFGPLRVTGNQHYELAIVTDESVHHFYYEPFVRDNHFLRLNSSRRGEGISAIVPTSEDSTNINVVRMREMWGDQGEESDRLVIDGTSVVEPDTSPRSNVNLALFAFDDGLDGVTNIEKGVVPPFGSIGFITALDVAIPAQPNGGRPVSVVQTVRGNEDDTVEINVPNWPSSDHAITVQFRDFTGDTK